MAKDDLLLRHSLLSVGTVMVAVGICTFSFKKMVVTYAFGLLGIAGLMLPDWDYFRRGFSQWCKPLSKERAGSFDGGTISERFGFHHPVGVILFITIYSYGFYKWWIYITT